MILVRSLSQMSVISCLKVICRQKVGIYNQRQLIIFSPRLDYRRVASSLADIIVLLGIRVRI